MTVLPHPYLNHKYGMCSSSTFVKFWKKIVHNVFKHYSCVCLWYLHFTVFQSSSSKIAVFIPPHVFVLNSHAHIPTTWIGFSCFSNHLFAASLLGFSTRTGSTLNSAIFLQPWVRTCFQQDSVSIVHLYTVLIACDSTVVVVHCSA
jgi:hypothetical protein